MKYQENLKTSLNYIQDSQNEFFVNTGTKLLKNRNWTFPVVCYLTWKLGFFPNFLSMIVVVSITYQQGFLKVF